MTPGCSDRKIPSQAGIRCSATVMLAHTVNSADRFGPHPFGDVEKLPRVGEDAARPVDDDGPLRSQSRPRRPSVYEWHPELPLEGFDGAAGIRLRNVC